MRAPTVAAGRARSRSRRAGRGRLRPRRTRQAAVAVSGLRRGAGRPVQRLLALRRAATGKLTRIYVSRGADTALARAAAALLAAVDIPANRGAEHGAGAEVRHRRGLGVVHRLLDDVGPLHHNDVAAVVVTVVVAVIVTVVVTVA